MMGRHTPDICERDNVFLQVDSMLCVVCRLCVHVVMECWLSRNHTQSYTDTPTHAHTTAFICCNKTWTESRCCWYRMGWKFPVNFAQISIHANYCRLDILMYIFFSSYSQWHSCLVVSDSVCFFFLYYWLTFSLRVRVVDQRQQLANDIIALLFLILLSSLWWDYMGQLDWNSNGGFCMSPMQVSHMKLFIVLLSEIQIWSWFEPIVIQWHAESSVSIPI